MKGNHMVWTVLLFALGLAIIIKGGDWFVEAAVWLAEITGVPKILIGATVVSLATTLPEFFVSVLAVSGGQAGLGIGNALGSIICNTGMILAISLVVRPSKVEKSLFYKKAIIMFVSLVVLVVASLDGVLSRLEAIPLLVLLGVFVFLNVYHVKKSNLEQQKQVHHIDTHRKKKWINIAKFVGGAAGIVVGAQLLVTYGSKIALALGVSEGIVGVTIIAVGTSLPELVTTITAIRKNEASLGIGNILGANILNMTMILSTCALIAPSGLAVGAESITLGGADISRTLFIDLPVVGLLFLLLIIPPIIFKGKLKRLQGISMLAVYIAFIALLVLNV
ncbi:MAG: calcium/sodium antiporter [Clostridia bacterium]|nr:calcium/sodium antiporter [Clostridia bacterium]